MSVLVMMRLHSSPQVIKITPLAWTLCNSSLLETLITHSVWTFSVLPSETQTTPSERAPQNTIQRELKMQSSEATLIAVLQQPAITLWSETSQCMLGLH